MKGWLRAPSPAFVISLVALFVALGGTAYATTSLPKNSVGTKQLRNNAVTTKKLKNRAVSKSKINFSGLIVPQALHADAADLATTAGASVYYHNSQGGGIVLAGLATLETVQSLTLPAGTFLVTAKHELDSATAGASDVDCYLFAGGVEKDKFYAQLPANESVPMVGTAVVVLSGTTQVSDECAEFGTTGSAVGYAAMSAIQLGSAKTS